ncbi:unnamed protein product [Cuscuta epithymum]|uniref:F-box domain-containing protein n=1 Tax=Cuscuta epithymum TaxID=186058 RepID=A0AAV0FSA1_9ASTE|nr:unnamed protein product [Cuscuta epithymum]
MSDIPSQLYHQILLSLPADSLFRFRSVCKEWCRLIDDPSFVKAHTQNQISSSTLLIKKDSGSPPFYLINFDSLEFADDLNDDGQMIEVIPVKQLVRLGVPRIQSLPVNSCNGLILISTYDRNKIWAVWNTLTRDCHQLPPPDCSTFTFAAAGLGYDHVSDDYKVVRLDTNSRGGKYVCRTLVYSLKLGSWKRIKDCPDNFIGLNRVNGFCVNGKLHWYACEMIITLDLVTEEYGHIPIPPISSSKEIFEMYLDAISGLLILSYSYLTSSGCDFDGWVLQEDGAENPWEKLFSFHLPYFESPKLVAYMKNKKKVILQRDDGFFWVDIESNLVKQVAFDGLIVISSQVCPGSLYRLDDRGNTSKPVSTSTGGVKRKRKQIKKRTITRLKILIRNESHYWSPKRGFDSTLGFYEVDEY